MITPQESWRQDSDSTYNFIDQDEPTEKIDMFREPAKNWRDTTIGDLVYAKDTFRVGQVKDAELAFFVRSHTRGVTDDTPCQIGLHHKGRALRIGSTEYRQRGGLLYEKAV